MPETKLRLFVHSYHIGKKAHVLSAVHENVPSGMTVGEITSRYGLSDLQTSYLRTAAGETIFITRHPDWAVVE